MLLNPLSLSHRILLTMWSRSAFLGWINPSPGFRRTPTSFTTQLVIHYLAPHLRKLSHFRMSVRQARMWMIQGDNAHRCVEDPTVCQEALETRASHTQPSESLAATLTWPLSPDHRGNSSVAVWPTRLACCVAGLGAFPKGCTVAL